MEGTTFDDDIRVADLPLRRTGNDGVLTELGPAR
jgi:hypothetical protein